MKLTSKLSAQLLVVFACVFTAPLLQADNVNVTVQSVDLTKDIQLRIDGIVVAKGVLNTPLTPGDEGAAVRMLWHPGKAAFRAGEVVNTTFRTNGSTYWNNANIGYHSFAAGFNAQASGAYSVAMGDSSSATTTNDIALGYHNNVFSGAAIGSQSSAYYGGYSFGASAYSYSNGVALGYTASASNTSAALGSNVTASYNSTAIGYYNNASNYSTALGNYTTAPGKYSTSMGFSTTAQAYASTVIGQFNLAQGSTTAWVDTDPLFVIGNGPPPPVGTTPVYSNAFVVKKNGDIVIPKRQGDILMGEFGN